MNTPAAKKEITNLLSALERSGYEGRRIASQFKMYWNRLERDARREFGLSEKDINMAFCDLLGVCLTEVTTGIDAEMSDYDAFLGDMRAYCKLNYNPDDEEEMCVVADDTTVDEVLSVEQKQDVYKMCAKVVREKLVKHGASKWDIEDIAGGMYARLLQKCVDTVFPRGMPTCEAEWMAFLRRDAEFARMNYYKKEWRHPTSSLDELITVGGCEDDGDDIRLTDALNYDEDVVWQPNRKDDFLNSFESQHELRYVGEACARLWARFTPRTRKALRRLLIDEADIETVSSELGMKANALYAARKRFLDMLSQEGQAMLSEVEATAA